MSGPLHKIASIVDQDFISQGPGNNEILSIELFQGGVSYALLDAADFRYLALEEYHCDRTVLATGNTTEEFFRDCLENLPLLNRPFLKVTVACLFSPLVLLPADVSENSEQEYLYSYFNHIPDNHLIRVDCLHNLGGNGIYTLPSCISDVLTKQYPYCRFRHAGSACIESVLSGFRLTDHQADTVLHVRDRSFEIMFLDKGRLTFYQSYEYQVFDDILYYLFFVFDQFNMDLSTTDLMLAGKIDMDSSEFSVLSSYFGTVGFAPRSDVYRYAPVFDTIPHHRYYNLINLNSCG